MPQTRNALAKFDSVADVTTADVWDAADVGTVYQTTVGPKLTGDATAQGKGWHADVRPASLQRTWDLNAPRSLAAGATIMGWHRFHNYGGATTGGGHWAKPMSILAADGTTIMAHLAIETNADGTGRLGLADFSVGMKAAHFDNIPICQWLLLALSFTYSAATFAYAAWYKTLGGTWTKLANYSLGTGTVPRYARWGNDPFGGLEYYTAQAGCIGLYSCSDVSTDVAPDATIVDPIEAPTTHYWNDTTGNATNDGLTAGTAINSVRVQRDARYAGFLGGATNAAGDVVRAMADIQWATLNTGNLRIGVPGLSLDYAGSGTKPFFDGCRPVTGWSAQGTTNVWTTTDSQYDTTVTPRFWQYAAGVRYELRKLLLSDFANEAALITYMGTHEGTFYTNPSAVAFCHPWFNEDPTAFTGGATIKRTVLLTGISANKYLNMLCSFAAKRLRVSNINFCNYAGDSTTNAPSVRAFIGDEDNSIGGDTLIENCDFDGGSKHHVSFGFAVDGYNVWVKDCTWGVYGGQGAFGEASAVVFAPDTSAASTATFKISGCVARANIGVFTDTSTPQGTTTNLFQSIYSHNGGDTTKQYASGQILNNTLASTISIGDDLIPSGQLTIQGNTCLGIVTKPALPVINQNTISGTELISLQNGGTLTNNLFKPTGRIDLKTRTLAGTVAIEGNTIDCRGVDPATAAGTAIFARGGAITPTGYDNLYILPTGIIAHNFNTGDTVDFDYNVYVTTVAGANIHSVSGVAKTLTTWRAIGANHDQNGINSTDAALQPTGEETAASPSRGVGVTRTLLAGLPDRAGHTRPATGALDAGAYQFAEAVSSGSDNAFVREGVAVRMWAAAARFR